MTKLSFIVRLKQPLTDVALILVGSLLMALSVDVFLDPNNVVPGGFTAVAMFANRLWGWPVGLTLLALNVPFLLAGMKVLGTEFGPKTILTTVTVGLAIDMLRLHVPVIHGEPLLYTVYGGLLFGLGQGLVFRANATSGGTEIPTKLLHHFYHVPMSKALLAMDVVILGVAAFFFGLAPALYAMIAAWVMARMVDLMEAGVKSSLSVFIITQRPDPIREAIFQQLDRGVTLLMAEGGYTGSQRPMLFTVVNRRQGSTLRKIVSAIDPQAFMVVNASNEVLGEGFTPLSRPEVLPSLNGKPNQLKDKTYHLNKPGQTRSGRSPDRARCGSVGRPATAPQLIEKIG